MLRKIALSISIASSLFLATPTNAEDGYAVLSTPILRDPAPSFKWNQDLSIHPDLAYKIRSGLETYYERDSQDLSLRFAGEYMIWTEGTGGYMTSAVLVDLNSGQPVLRLPDTVTGYKFWPDRHQLVVNPYRPGVPHDEETSTSYYLWIGGQLVLTAEEPWPDEDITGSID